MTLTTKDVATALDGCEYRKEDGRFDKADLKDAGIVVVFGASDDLMEFRGAIYDEIGAYDGTTAFVTPAGLMRNQCDDDHCPYYEAALKEVEAKGAVIHAIWDDEGAAATWTYTTAIPHETFMVYEDGEAYCQGIVFALADVPA